MQIALAIKWGRLYLAHPEFHLKIIIVTGQIIRQMVTDVLQPDEALIDAMFASLPLFQNATKVVSVAVHFANDLKRRICSDK